MSVLIGIGIGAVALSAYIGRKGWLAFHRAVGITPGKVTYLSPKSEVNIPKLIALEVDTTVLKFLPKEVITALKRIDTKATTYRQWQQTMQQTKGERPYLEEEFVVEKLLNEYLPHIIAIYVNYIQVHASHAIQDKQLACIEDENEAYQTLIALLDDIESRLDTLLNQSKQARLQELKIMKRYLDKR